EFAPNHPPPLVPKCLMALSAAIGPRLILCWPWDVAEGVASGVGVTFAAGATWPAAAGWPARATDVATSVGARGASGPFKVVAVSAPENVAGIPSPTNTTAITKAMGSRMRVQARVRST